MYTSKDFDERQKIMSSHYKFDCVCTACIEKWPTLPEMSAERNLDPEDMRMNRCDFQTFSNHFYIGGGETGETAEKPGMLVH